MKRAESRQLSFGFADSPQGSGKAKSSDVSEAEARLLHIASDKGVVESAARADPDPPVSGLLERAASAPNMARALLNVARNRGAAGVDGRSVKEVVEASPRLLPKLQSELLAGTFAPGDIRRVWIPKPGGQGQRGLGIPNVVDRWVQQCVLQVLEPIFEPTFHPSSHGFRPNRGAHTAIAEATKHICDGFDWVVDIDLSKFFDRVNHQRLLSRLAQRVQDGRILKLVHRMLKAKVVLPDGTRVSTTEGTMQGGPLSPLLSNVVLDELDWELERRGLRFVRYADDVNIFVRSERAGRRVLGSIRRFVEGRLRLKINEEKSSVDRPSNLHFLGFCLKLGKEGRVEVHMSERTEQRLNQRIRELTPRAWGGSLTTCIGRVNRYLRGWFGYFRICTETGARRFGRYDAHIRRRLRAILVRQKGKRSRFLSRHLRARGVSEGPAWTTAHGCRGAWAKSVTYAMHRAYGNAWFTERVVTLCQEWLRLHPPERVSGGQLELFAT
ncbi:MAG: group II intron reverse transcriptase/maturase [Deltaproteobacteria bacterium]|nr:group II intron reverse transcriptase/maturase [Deltaproteobacteria bacterium]